MAVFWLAMLVVFILVKRRVGGVTVVTNSIRM